MEAAQRAVKKAVEETQRKEEAEATAKELAAKQLIEEQAKQQVNPTGMPDTLHCDVARPDSVTVVVNKQHCFNPVAWAPSDLTGIDGFLMRAIAASHMSEMMQATNAAGVGFGLTSTYRSYANQQTTYANWVSVNGSQAAADTVSARPGFSEHQTGLAADLKTDGCVLLSVLQIAKPTRGYEHTPQNMDLYSVTQLVSLLLPATRLKLGTGDTSAAKLRLI